MLDASATTLSDLDTLRPVSTSPVQRRVVLLVDDIDREIELAGTGCYDANGRSFGCKIVDVTELASVATEDAVADSVLAADPLDRVYNPTESGALAEARRIATRNGWAVIDAWNTLVA